MSERKYFNLATAMRELTQTVDAQNDSQNMALLPREALLRTCIARELAPPGVQ